MPEARRREATAVVVNHHGAVDYLVAAIAVYIRHAIVMIALSVPWAAGCVAGPSPTLGQLVRRRIDIVGNHLMARIDAASQEDAGVATVEERSAHEVFARAMTIVVAPSRFLRTLAALQPGKRIVLDPIRAARLPVQIDEVLSPRVRPFILRISVRAEGSTRIDRRVADRISGAVGHVNDHVVGSPQQDLSLPSRSRRRSTPYNSC